MEGAKATPTDLLVMMSVKQIAMVRKMWQNLLSNDMHSVNFAFVNDKITYGRITSFARLIYW